jgi:hypothetical protein
MKKKSVRKINTPFVRYSRYQWMPAKPKEPFGHYAVIKLDSTVIKADFMRRHQEIKRLFEQTQAQWHKHCSEEKPEYERWEHLTFGSLEQEIRELQSMVHRKDTLYRQAELYADYCDISTPAAFCIIEAHLKEGGDIQELFNNGEKSGSDGGDFEDEDIFDDIEDIIGDFFKDLFGNKDDDERFHRSGRHHEETTHEHKTASNHEKRLRLIYWKLCRQLHPDTGCEFNEYNRELWHTIQEAYKNKDLERLETIQARLDLQNDISNGAVSCSGILAVIKEFEQGIKSVTSLINKAKRQRVWGFLRWPEKKRTKHQAAVITEKTSVISTLRAEIEGYDELFEKWRKASSKRKSVKKPKQGSKKSDLYQDFFDL